MFSMQYNSKKIQLSLSISSDEGSSISIIIKSLEYIVQILEHNLSDQKVLNRGDIFEKKESIDQMKDSIFIGVINHGIFSCPPVIQEENSINQAIIDEERIQDANMFDDFFFQAI